LQEKWDSNSAGSLLKKPGLDKEDSSLEGRLRNYVGILPISTILTMCSAISIATCFTFFGFLHDAFEKLVVEDWKG